MGARTAIQHLLMAEVPHSLNRGPYVAAGNFDPWGGLVSGGYGGRMALWRTSMATAMFGMQALVLSACVDKANLPRPMVQADAAEGLAIIEEVGCAACHAIPGVDWPKGRSAGSLAGFGARPMIAGRLPNQPDVLIRWLIDAPSLDPGTAMPPMPLTQDQARDVAAYLYTLDDR